MGVIVVTPMSCEAKARALDLTSGSKATRPTTIDSFVQKVPTGMLSLKSQFWTMTVDNQSLPKDLFHQSLPCSYRRAQDAPIV